MILPLSKHLDRCCWILFATCCWLLPLAQLSANVIEPIVFATGHEPDRVTPQLSVWNSQEQPQSIESLLRRQQDHDWHPLPASVNSLGYQNKPTWFRVDLLNVTGRTIERLVVINAPVIEQVDFYRVENGMVTERYSFGNNRPYTMRLLDHPKYLAPFPLEPGRRVELYFKVRSKRVMMLPLEIWQDRAFFTFDRHSNYWKWSSFGIIVFAILFNLVIYLTLREAAYLYYVLFTSFALLVNMNLQGVGFELLWPSMPQFNSHPVVLVPLMAAAMSEFTRQFLTLEARARQLIAGLTVLNLLVIPLMPFVDAVTANAIGVFAALISFILITCVGYLSALQRQPGALTFSIAISATLLGGFIVVARGRGWLPANEFTNSAFQLGIAVEAITLSMAIAARIYGEKMQRLQAKEQAAALLQQRLQAERKLIEQASRNPLTQLPNQQPLMKAIQALIEREPREHFALWCMELRNARELEITLGSEKLVELLRSYAHRFEQFLASMEHNSAGPIEAKVYALQHDTLAFLSPADRTFDLRKRLEKQIQKPEQLDGIMVHLLPTAGLAIFPTHASDADTLLSRAQLALNSTSNINRIVTFSSESEALGRERMQQLLQLEPALANGDMRLHLQPKVRLNEMQIGGFEALIRWYHPEHGIVPPHRFIPLAERTGLINIVTLWVIEQAVLTLKRFKEAGYGYISLSVNISALDLSMPGFEKRVLDLLAEANIDPGKLCLELTESAALQDLEVAKNKLTLLNQHGIRLSMDDFGTGYSSLVLLQELALDELKIDRSLLNRAHESASQRRILSVAVDIGKTLQLECVCEGIETLGMLELVREMGCEWGQGYLFAGPMQIDDALQLLADDPYQKYLFPSAKNWPA